MLLRFLLKKLFAVREKKDRELVKPFLDHLEDLRWALLKIVVALGLAMVLSFAFRAQIAHLVEEPLRIISGNGVVNLQTLHPVDSMSISMTLSFYAGIVFSFPLLSYFVAEFVLPALNQNERRYVIPLVLVGFSLFLTGAFCCFKFILPATLRWLYYDQKNMNFAPEWRATDYFSFATQFVVIFGLMFELPVVVVALVKLGILEAATLRKTRAYALVIILIASLIISPSPDPGTWAIVAGPMLALYEICIWLAWGLERRERRLAMRPTRET